MTPEQFEKSKGKWPFKRMAVDDVVKVEETHGLSTAEIQTRCHSYGANQKKKFSTSVIDGFLWVRRIS